MTQQLDQIALSVVDLRRTERWFREALGFIPAGGTRCFRDWVAQCRACPRRIDLLVAGGPQRALQLELFQFERPLARLMAADFRPCDIGYRASDSGCRISIRRSSVWRRSARRRSRHRWALPARVGSACATPRVCSSK